jgi:hypothetical protein
MKSRLVDLMKRYDATTAYLRWISAMTTGLFILKVIETWQR